ncbi:hypothetical protein JTE90_018463 [Oedothorax gibbosus]|uniref:Fatty acid desaturase domain-containing protein n=1 Tax=Oedothorax gibbosus TaxID=931172 RepID=A0AAV6UXL7_9ARAC|nr:hypothetical protein JTE90_018463 [Oedothorax gibbosus]
MNHQYSILLFRYAHLRFKMAPQATVAEANMCQPESSKKSTKPYKLQIIWYNVILLSLLHVGALYGFYTMSNWRSILFHTAFGFMAGFGITAGAHRLWSHRSYKARLPLRIILASFVCIAAETDIYVWCRDHRVHHKYTETDADPHNIKRGFFFAHVGWLMCKKHPEVTNKGKKIYLGDLTADPVVRFQRKYHIPLSLFCSFLLPTMMAHLIFGDSEWNAFLHCISRYVCVLNATWLVNSAAHMFGDRPFDKEIHASESTIVALIAAGEGWHNYHHVFPWDYSTSELGYTLNLTKIFIDVMAWLGLAYDLKSATKEEVLKRKLKTGDGTRLELQSSVRVTDIGYSHLFHK